MLRWPSRGASIKWRCIAPLGDIAAVLTLTSAPGAMVLGFPEQTASALAGRILSGVTAVIDGQLIRDCVGEIANVIVGQAKAMLAGTSYHFAFSVPNVTAACDGPCLAGPGLSGHRVQQQLEFAVLPRRTCY